MIKLKLILENKYYFDDVKFFIDDKGRYTVDTTEHVNIIQNEYPKIWNKILKYVENEGYIGDYDIGENAMNGGEHHVKDLGYW